MVGKHLVGWWKLDGDLTDSSGNGNTMVCSLAESYGAGKVTPKSEIFSGDRYCHETTILSYVKRYSPMTMMAWIKTSGLTNSQTLNGIIALSYSRTLSINSSGILTARYPGSGFDASGSSSLYDNVWHHVAYSDDLSVKKLFIDGTLVSSVSVSTSDGTYENGVYIGRDPNDSPYKFSGSINDVKIYDIALTAEEIKRESLGNIVRYTFDRDGGETAYDSSGYGRNGVIASSTAPVWTTDSARGSGAMYYDHTRKFITLSSVVSLLPTMTSVSVSFWRKNPSGSTLWLILRGQGSGQYLMASQNGHAFYSGNCGSSLTYYIDGEVATAPPADLLWHHYCVTGVNLSSWTALTMADYSSFYISGTIADFKMFSTTLSASDVLNEYKNVGYCDALGEFNTPVSLNEVDGFSLPSETSYITINDKTAVYSKNKSLCPLMFAKDFISLVNEIPLLSSSSITIDNYESRTPYVVSTDGRKITWTSNSDADTQWGIRYSGLNLISGDKIVLSFKYLSPVSIASAKIGIGASSSSLQTIASDLPAVSSLTSYSVIFDVSTDSPYLSIICDNVDLASGKVASLADVSLVILDKNTRCGQSFLDVLSSASLTTNAQIKTWFDMLPWFNGSYIIGQGQKIENLITTSSYSFSSFKGQYNFSNVVPPFDADAKIYSSLISTVTYSTTSYPNVWPLTYNNWSWGSYGVGYINANQTDAFMSKVETASKWSTVNRDACLYTPSTVISASGKEITLINLKDTGLRAFLYLLGLSTDAELQSFLDEYFSFFDEEISLEGALEKSEKISCYNPSGVLIPMERFAMSKRYSSSLSSDFNELGVSNGLYLWYPLDGDTKDYSGNNNDGNISGATVSVGKGQSCYSFDGNLNYIQSSSPVGDLWSGDFSFSVMLKRSDSTRSIIYGEFNRGSQVNIELTTSGTPRFWWGGSPDKIFSSTVIPISEWCLLTITRSGGTLKSYLNGVLIETYEGTLANKTATTNFRLGMDFRGGNSVSYLGLMQDVRFYKKALSDQEVKILYNTAFERKFSISNCGVFSNNFNEIS